MTSLEISQLESFANLLRVSMVQMTHRARASHVGSGLSMADILAVLYGSILRVRPTEPEWAERDRLILSKGHAVAGLYAALAERGFFPKTELETFCKDGSRLAGHATHRDVPGIECSTGSLGHGLSIACGMALASRNAAAPFRVFAILSDGECDEGSTWEAALFAGHHALDNLTVIVDYNHWQSLGSTKDVLGLEPFADKWRAFGWYAREIDGHSVADLLSALENQPLELGKPTCVLANTVKGKGVSFMEDRLLWHYRTPQGDEYTAALRELGVDEK